jgi:membrane-associated PAP2 superfamily phosphatase
MKQLIITIAVIILVIILLLVVGKESAGRNSQNLEAFAQCLAAKNITLYGEDTCAYCQQQLALFGDSSHLVPYIECRREPKKCLEQNIDNFPTWIFPDNRRFVGRQSLATLAQESGCRLP